MAATAHGGQLVLTAPTVALVGRSLPPGVELRSLGEFRLKDLNEPEEIYQAVIEGLESVFPPLKTLDALPLAVPLILSSFVGRTAELDRAVELLESTRILTLTGPGGAGKTRMAVQLARDLAPGYPGGVFFVSLEAVTELEQVPLAILDAMGAARDEDHVFGLLRADADDLGRKLLGPRPLHLRVDEAVGREAGRLRGLGEAFARLGIIAAEEIADVAHSGRSF